MNLIQTGKELDLSSKCSKCGEPLYKIYKIFDKDRIVRRMCKCEREKYHSTEKQKQAQRKQMQLQKLIRNSLMDKKFLNSTFENWNFERGSKQMYSLGKRYVANFQKCKTKGIGLLIHGQPGNGKTYLVSAIANALLEQYVSVVCASINAILSRIQTCYKDRNNITPETIINGLNEAHLLIIDDLGTEQHTDWSKSMIYSLIDARYRSGLPILITSNLEINPEESNGVLAEIYDRRTEDRIFEMCTPILNMAQGIRILEAKKKTAELRKILYENGGKNE